MRRFTIEAGAAPVRLAAFGLAALGLAVLGLAALALLDVGPAIAQGAYAPDGTPRSIARAPTRIIVTPGRRLVRECVDWYALEQRPSGPVITPQQRCVWAYR